MIARDLHFHDCYPQRVVNRTQVCGLQQLGAKSTSVLGHTLDATTCDPGPCYHIKKLARDHFAVGFIKAIFKPSNMHTTVSNEQIRAIDEEDFKFDIFSVFHVTNYTT